jgi:hypothetical protein
MSDAKNEDIFIDEIENKVTHSWVPLQGPIRKAISQDHDHLPFL